MGRWADGKVNGQMDERLDGWINGQMKNGWVGR